MQRDRIERQCRQLCTQGFGDRKRAGPSGAGCWRGGGRAAQALPRVQVEYRTEKHNFMRTLHTTGRGGKLVAVKGSPAEVLEMCGWWIKDGVRLPLTETERTAILIENDRMAGEALRVLGFAYVELAQVDQFPAEELVWLGLTGMADPVREGMKSLIALFHQAVSIP